MDAYIWEIVAMLPVAFLALKEANTSIMCHSDHVFYLSIWLTRPKIIDASWTLISMIAQWAGHYLVAYKNRQCNHLGRT